MKHKKTAALSEAQVQKKMVVRKMTGFLLCDEIEQLDKLPGLSCIADTDGYLVAVSDSFAEALGRTKRELTTQTFFNFIHADDIVKTWEVYAAQPKGARVDGFTNRWKHADGHYIKFTWLASEALSDGYIRAKVHIED